MYDSLLLAMALVAAGIPLILFSAGRLVRGALGTARGFGFSPFFITVVFIGFDPENLGVGVAGTVEGVTGIAIGSIIGAAMVAIALALGITAVIVPLEFERAPKAILVLPVLAVVLFGALALDGRLSRLDGAILVAGYVAAILAVLYLSKQGKGIEARPGERMERAEGLGGWRAFGLLLLSLGLITAGSEMVVEGSRTVIEWLGVSDTFYGVTILALLISIEEVARELPAAWKGHPEVSIGNVVGSVFAFFLMNAGVIALAGPFAVEPEVVRFHLPVALGTTLVIAVMMLNHRITRWHGGFLILVYLGFVAGSYFLGSSPGAVTPGS